ncbi:hypothetical protein ONS95_007881 [Cadophora gregata]|uniref:uncharacterized protein n=1 Tax=Cadophora gregata TaxID=51156 RepID=UPI0026DC4537|nr:uncharacterized protein ONS95_007881 [Cadophora gregata]KAK0126269.1 hypothetical protein ONS95_007881 [Cadophora gregata]
MAPKTAAKWPTEEMKKAPTEEEREDTFREPESSSDDGKDDIIEGQYIRGSANLGDSISNSKSTPPRTQYVAAKKATETDRSFGTRKETRGSKLPSSSSSSSIGSNGSTKRNGVEQIYKLEEWKTDDFGSVRRRKKVKTKYGSKSQVKILVSKKKPKDKFKVYGQMKDSPLKSETSKHLKVVSDIETSPESTPKRRKYKPSSDVDSPRPTKTEQKSLKIYDMDDLSDSDEGSAERATKKLRIPQLHESPAKQKEGLKDYAIGLEPDLISKAKSLIDKDQDELDPGSQSMEDYDFSTMTQQARCPMCGATVDPEDIRAYSKNGVMNIRTQEKFCREHKTRTAQDDWEIKSYPTIDWDSLDSRISKHHAFIKKLINGQHSYYRELMDDTVLGGKDRNLMKMTSNLTPGYYGARGLRIFSENIMRKFTPLLKERLPHDPVMSARGFTAYVQSVLVPEVVVRLIMEDMDVDVEKGREILADSVNVGELLSEEIKDVVTKRVVDSEGEDESD